MDWRMILFIVLWMSAAAAVSVWKVYGIKKEVYLFESQVEQALDEIIERHAFWDSKSEKYRLARIGEQTIVHPGELRNKETNVYAGESEYRESERCRQVQMEELADTLWGKCKERIERADQIWQKKERKSRKEKEQIKELIADISHQTKTPIANMKLYLEFLQEEALSEKGMEFLKCMEGQMEKLDFLLQSMVKMSRLETGVIQIKCGQCSLYETIAAAASEIVPSAAKKEIELYVDCDQKIKVWHDRKWVEEAVFNVLDNAVKYTQQGGHIYVHAACQEIYAKISIRDDGKGIVPERQAEIFTRFYREPEVHEQSGIGIGLYLARQILEMQGGYIEVHSEQGKGSEFCLYLPV